MTAADSSSPAPKTSKLPLILALVLGVAGAAGGFVASRMGLIAMPGGDTAGAAEGEHAAMDDHASMDGHTAEDEHAAEPGSHDTAAADDHSAPEAGNFVPLDPLVVNVHDQAGGRFLRFSAEIEAEPGHAAEVEAIRPRFADVLNGYLRAVDLADLQSPQALDLLRSQMLRRLQTVAGEGVVRDLLITEFVLN